MPLTTVGHAELIEAGRRMEDPARQQLSGKICSGNRS